MHRYRHQHGFFIVFLMFFLSTFALAQEKGTHGSVSIPVSITPLNNVLFYPVRDAPATVVSLNHSLISAEIAGQIVAIPVQSGDRVKQGDILAQIDCEPYQIAKKRATAALNAAYAHNRYAKKRFADAKTLRKKKVLSLDEYNLRSSEANEAASQVGVLNADVKEATRRIAKCTITAPYDAVVTARLASIGDYAQPGMPLVQLLDNQHLEVSAHIQQQDIDSFKLAQKHTFITAKHRYPVEIRTIIPLVDRRVRSFEARLSFTAVTAPSGAAGRVQWQSRQAHIPADFLVLRQGKTGVFIVQGKRARFHPLPDAKVGLPAPIDLPANTAIVTTGRYSLLDGQPIQIIKP